MNLPRLFTIPDSSNLDALGYDAEAARLFVRFKGPARSVYAYEAVTPQQLGQLLSAPSVGETFTTLIKQHPDAHPFQRLTADAIPAPAKPPKPPKVEDGGTIPRVRKRRGDA